MKTKPPCALVLAVLLSFLLAIPADTLAAPQGAGQRAGEVSRLIPAVSIARGPKSTTASPKSIVNWQDLVNTQVNARARIALDDGSVLNVGSESSKKIAKPDGKFEVRTPAGVAGVVGTDFFVGYDVNAGAMNVIVFEGLVKVCNLAGVCVLVKAGQMTNVRNGDNSAPAPPTQATLDMLVASSTATDAGGTLGAPPVGPHLGLGWTIGILVAIPAIAVPIAVTRPKGRQPPVCNPKTNPNGCGLAP